MINWFLIPLLNTPISFQITLAGVNYTMTVKWNTAPDAGWEFDLANADTNAQIVSGVPLITGADCLANLQYLGFGGVFIVVTQGNPAAVPTYANLGGNCNLYFVTETA